MTAHNHTRFRDLRLPVRQPRRLTFGWPELLLVAVICGGGLVVANACFTTAVALAAPSLPGGGW